MMVRSGQRLGKKPKTIELFVVLLIHLNLQRNCEQRNCEQTLTSLVAQ